MSNNRSRSKNSGAKGSGSRGANSNNSSGKNSGAKNSGGNNSNSGRKSSSRNRRRKNKLQAKKFWAEGQSLPPLDVVIDPTPDPGAVVRSLGTPPLAGQNHKAEEYFEAVYHRAVGLATALAAAGGLPIAEPDDE